VCALSLPGAAHERIVLRVTHLQSSTEASKFPLAVTKGTTLPQLKVCAAIVVLTLLPTPLAVAMMYGRVHCC
jgi:hypothetical protein